MPDLAAPRLLDSKLLRCFLAVMEYGSVTIASEVLCLTQSATSKNILRLEEELGAELFDRSAGGMTPTIYGITLARHARLIDNESINARGEIERLKRGGYGTLRITSGPMWTVHMLPDAIEAMLRKRPGVRIRADSGVIDTMVPQLLKGEVDLVCASLDFPDHSDIEKLHLFEVEYIVLARHEHPLLQQHEKIDADDLLRFPWVGLSNDLAANRRISQFFSSNGLESPEIVVETSSFTSMLAIALTGNFLVGVASPILAHAERLGLVRIPVNASFWRFSAGVAVRRNHGQPLVTEMIELLRAQA